MSLFLTTFIIFSLFLNIYDKDYVVIKENISFGWVHCIQSVRLLSVDETNFAIYRLNFVLSYEISKALPERINFVSRASTVCNIWITHQNCWSKCQASDAYIDTRCLERIAAEICKAFDTEIKNLP